MGNDSDSSQCGRFAIISAVLRLAICFVLLIVLGNSSRVAARKCATKNLRFIILIHRHGDRTPVYSYPTDPYRTRKWSAGFGALTRKGAEQMCNLGLIIKDRYDSFLPAAGLYTPNNTRVCSSSVERAVKSVKSLLACMTSRYENGHMIFVYQPVNFTIVPSDMDTILKQSKPCPKYDAMLNGIKTKPRKDTDIYNFNQRHTKLYKYVSKYAGKKIEYADGIGDIYDTLRIQHDHNLQLPHWTRSVFPSKLREVRDRSSLLRTENDYMKRNRGGKLATEIVTQLLRKKKMPTELGKIEIYSAHDITLVNLLNALGLIPQTTATPDYGAAIAFELHESHQGYGDWFVEIVYFSDANDRNPKKLKIPNCSHPCKIESFRKSIDKIWLTQEQYDDDCKV